MQDHVSRLVGLDGFRVNGVIEDGDQLDLEVELVARAGSCRHCGWGSIDIKDRPQSADPRSADRRPPHPSHLAQAPLPLRRLQADLH